MRIWVFLFFILNFIILMVSMGRLSREAFELVGLPLVHSSLMALALILLSFWVWTDGNEIEDLRERIDRLHERIRQREKE